MACDQMILFYKKRIYAKIEYLIIYQQLFKYVWYNDHVAKYHASVNY